MPISLQKSHAVQKFARAGWQCPDRIVHMRQLACVRAGPGRVAQSVGHLTRKSGVLGSIPGVTTYFRFSFRFFKKGSFIQNLSGIFNGTCLHILAGDFNCVLDGMLDRKPPCGTKDQGYNEMNGMILQAQLPDIFRKQFPLKSHLPFRADNRSQE